MYKICKCIQITLCIAKMKCLNNYKTQSNFHAFEIQFVSVCNCVQLVTNTLYYNGCKYQIGF